MEKTNYHHGALKEEMIEKGLLIINNEGIKGFSLRKVAGMCGVSHTAPYKHFKNKEELMEAISNRVLESFSECLRRSIEEGKNNPRSMTFVGKAYIKYMLEHREHFKFIFSSECGLHVKLEGNQFTYNEGNPFEVFCAGATARLGAVITDPAKLNAVILSMWSIVHGFSTLVINNTFEYEGDYEELADRILTLELK